MASVKRVVAKFKEGIAKLPAKSEPKLWQAYLAFVVLQKNKNPDPEIVSRFNRGNVRCITVNVC